MLSLQQGGYMTLAKFAMIFWHDLAAPILAGIITAAILSLSLPQVNIGNPSWKHHPEPS
ncbi:toxin Ldr, type I toxin-antitoxin system family protein [Escherichia coli 2-177-06_S3_C1]|nr:toxin Ldr, type I toxin-antitoxin system family protein [Escherichia coli 2-177-06_S3_C1]